MTVKELIEKLQKIPENTIVCIYAAFTEDYVELNNIEYIDGEVAYYTPEDGIKKSKIVAI